MLQIKSLQRVNNNFRGLCKQLRQQSPFIWNEIILNYFYTAQKRLLPLKTRTFRKLQNATQFQDERISRCFSYSKQKQMN